MECPEVDKTSFHQPIEFNASSLKTVERALLQDFQATYQLTRDIYLCLLFVAQSWPGVELGLEKVESRLRLIAAANSMLQSESTKLVEQSLLDGEMSSLERDKQGTVLQTLLVRYLSNEFGKFCLERGISAVRSWLISQEIG